MCRVSWCRRRRDREGSAAYPRILCTIAPFRCRDRARNTPRRETTPLVFRRYARDRWYFRSGGPTGSRVRALATDEKRALVEVSDFPTTVERWDQGARWPWLVRLFDRRGKRLRRGHSFDRAGELSTLGLATPARFRSMDGLLPAIGQSCSSCRTIQRERYIRSRKKTVAIPTTA